METIESRDLCSKVPASLREGLSWMLARLAQRFIGVQNGALAELGLSMRSFGVLATVSERIARTQMEIAQIVGLDKSTLVATIDDLERRGLVERRADPADRRARVVESTAQGRDLAARAAATVAQAESELLAGLHDGEAVQLKSALLGLLSRTGGHSDAIQPGSCM
jgi:DNA-binding MarR family transcriptional regulator